MARTIPPVRASTASACGRRRSRPVRAPGRVVCAACAAGAVLGVSAAEPAAGGDDDANALAAEAHADALDRDPEGLSTLTSTRRRSPAGLLYPWPPRRDLRADVDDPTVASLEIGWLFSRGDEQEARFREYLDPRDGLWIRRFRFEHLQRATRDRFSLVAGSVGRTDGSYRAGWRRPGRFDLRARYDALEHTYSTRARTLYAGIGGERLRLPTSLTPGDNAVASIDAALASVGPRRVALSRNESEVALVARLRPDLVLRSSYRLERRDGERPWGGTLGLPFGLTNAGSVVETLEPIQQRTHDWSTRLEWAGPRAQANVGYDGSHFDNRREQLVWENPFAATDLGAIQIPGQPLGRMALAPDNDRHRISGDLAVRTFWRGRLSLSASWSRLQQDESLLPATMNPAVNDFVDLSRRRADARVDLWNAQVAWRLRPFSALSLSARARVMGRDNDTEYRALNPTTGRFGYVVEDLAATSRVGAVPFSHRRIEVETTAGLRLSRRLDLELEYEHRRMHRSGRARRETRDDRARLGLRVRGPAGSLHRLAYEVRHRGGSDYDPTRDNEYYAPAPGSAFLAGPSRSLRSFRQLDLARHTSHALDLRSTLPLGGSTDLGLVAGWRRRDFGAEHGLQRERSAQASLDLVHRPAPWIDLQAFASLEWRDRRLATIDSSPGPAFSFLPGGPVFPLANAWSWSARATTALVGFAASVRPVEALTLSLDYQLQITNESTRSGFDRAGGALTPGVDPAVAPTSLPVVRLRDHRVEAAATWRPAGPLETTLYYRVHVSSFDDAQQRGLVPRVNQLLYLAHRDRDFVAHLVGVTATLRY